MSQNTILMGAWRVDMYAGQLCMHGYGIVRECERVPGVICGPNSLCHVLITGVAVPFVVAARGGAALPPKFRQIAGENGKDVRQNHPSFLTCRITNNRGLALLRNACTELNNAKIEEEEAREPGPEDEGPMEDNPDVVMANPYECTVIPCNVFGEMMNVEDDFQFTLITFNGGLQKERASDGTAMFVTQYENVRLVRGGPARSEAARIIFQGVEDRPQLWQDIRLLLNDDDEAEWPQIFTEAGEEEGLDGRKLEWCRTFDAKKPWNFVPEELGRLELPIQTRRDGYIHVYEWARDEDDSNALLGMGITEYQYGAMIRIANHEGEPLRPCRIRISREPDVLYQRTVSDLSIFMVQYDMNSARELDYTPDYIKPGDFVINLLMGKNIDKYVAVEREKWIDDPMY